MDKAKRIKRYNDENFKHTQALIFVISAVLCGVFCGFMITIYIPQNDTHYISDLFNFFVQTINFSQENMLSRLYFSLFNNFKYIILIFISFFTPLKLFFIPCILAFKGFFTSFSVSALIYHRGASGFVLSFLTTGINLIFSLPALLILATILITYSTNKSSFSQVLQIEYSLLKISALLTFISIIIDVFVSPILVGFIF